MAPSWYPLKNVNKIQVSDNFDPLKIDFRKSKNSLKGIQFFDLLTLRSDQSVFFLLPLSIPYQPERWREEGKYINKGILHDLTPNFKCKSQKKCTEDSVENCYWDHIGTKRFSTTSISSYVDAKVHRSKVSANRRDTWSQLHCISCHWDWKPTIPTRRSLENHVGWNSQFLPSQP